MSFALVLKKTSWYRRRYSRPLRVNVVCQVTSPATYKAPVCLKPRQRQNKRAKGVMLQIVCVSLLTLHYERGYTQFVRGLLGSEARRVGSRGGRLPAL